MDLFPIGTIAASTSQGTIDGVSYSMFEPNVRCSSQEIHTILNTLFEQQIMLSRKKAEPMLTLSYEYNNIYDREWRQLEHFIYYHNESLTPFYLIDFSKGQTPSGISASGDWTVSIANTRLYSATTNYKANRAILWNGSKWKEGQITTVTANTSVVVDVDTNEYGSLVIAEAQANAIIYPLYEVYLSPGGANQFKTTEYWDESVTISNDGGWMRSGTISFIGKYKV